MNIQVLEQWIAGASRPFVQILLGPRPEPYPAQIQCPLCFRVVPVEMLGRANRESVSSHNVTADKPDVLCWGSDLPIKIDTEYGQRKLV